MVEIYSTRSCGWCVRAKQLLDSLGIAYSEIDVSNDPTEMVQRTNGRFSVPQIFVNDVHVGGYDDLVAAHGSGKLESLLLHGHDNPLQSTGSDDA